MHHGEAIIGPAMDLSQYYDRTVKAPLLSREEELDLFLELQDAAITEKRAQEIRDRIIQANMRFVFREAKRYSRTEPWMFEELVSAGNVGLLIGLQKYDPNSGFKFLTYAGWWVKQSILDHMSRWRLVRLPVGKQQLSSRIQRFLDSHEGATFEQLKEAFPEDTEKDLRELYQTRYLTFHIEDMGHEDSAFEINPIEDRVHAEMDKTRLHTAVSELPHPHGFVLEKLFGLADGVEVKVKDLALIMEKKQSEVKVIRAEALVMLKEKFGGENPFAD